MNFLPIVNTQNSARKISRPFGVRSKQRLCEEIHLNLAYRLFCRLQLCSQMPDHSAFSKSRHSRFRNIRSRMVRSAIAVCNSLLGITAANIWLNRSECCGQRLRSELLPTKRANKEGRIRRRRIAQIIGEMQWPCHCARNTAPAQRTSFAVRSTRPLPNVAL